MAGNVFDLNDPAVALPDYIVVDTNIIVERVLSSLNVRLPVQNPRQSRQAAGFFQRLLLENSVGIVTPTAYGELIHVILGRLLKEYGLQQNPKLGAREVHKRFPGFIKTLEPTLRSLRLILARNGLKFVSMDRVELVDAIAPFDEYLITLCCDFGLNVGDARVLIEAQRLGIGSIATMDGDMQRASANFDIYTWL